MSVANYSDIAGAQASLDLEQEIVRAIKQTIRTHGAGNKGSASIILATLILVVDDLEVVAPGFRAMVRAALQVKS